MGKTSNAAKQKWNASHYVQVKFSVKPETAAAFKAACASAGDTMASVLSAFMLRHAGKPNEQNTAPVNVKTLKDRRKTAIYVHNIIAALIDAEEMFYKNAPANLRDSERYDMAQERVDRLEEALAAIDAVYDE